MPEVQKHGFTWEKDLLRNVYGATDEELAAIHYTSKMDLPGSLNKLEKADISIKTSNSTNTVCMADWRRVYSAVGDDKPYHMTVVFYWQDDATQTKKLVSIIEVDLTNSRTLLFGSLTQDEIEVLDKTVKAVPQKRRPTPEEHEKIYSIRNAVQTKSGAIYFNPKCDSSQSRLQCSFNRFQKFLEENPGRILAKSTTNEFRGKQILAEVKSGRRVFRKKVLPETS